MNVLLLGDEHIYGYGLRGRQRSYAGHFMKQLSRTGRRVTVEAYAHLTVSESIALLARLPLDRYDLIVVQLGAGLIARRFSLGSQSDVKAGTRGQILEPPECRNRSAGSVDKLRLIGQTVRSLATIAASAIPGSPAPEGLTRLLALLRPYRHNVLLVSPFPGRTSLGQWLSLCARSVLLKKGVSQTFSVFDTHSVVQPKDEYFLTNDTEHLNAVSHELLGRALFDFYQSAPTIITVQTINRN